MAIKKHKKNNNKPIKHELKKERVKKIVYSGPMSVQDLASKIHVKDSEVIKILFMMGNMVTINSILNNEMIELVCMELNIETEFKEEVSELEIENLLKFSEEDEKNLESRPPVVTIMGHVDHGKTTLLDTIRKTNVTSSEFGGITQHIGAYQVSYKNKKITFLDTPGHEAFTAMRSRGAKVTDIVIIVVAADDGVKPQTIEAIDHAKAAGVPIIVAVNKIDKAEANYERVLNEMANYGVMSEEWGGSSIFNQVSAKNKIGIQELLESILLVAEIEELKSNPKTTAVGTVIEAKLDKGRGPVVSLLVQKGTLHTNDFLVVGTAMGRVRKMCDDSGKEIKEALPSKPVEIIGLNEVPTAGDIFAVFNDEKKARTIAQKRQQEKILKERNESSKISLDNLSNQITNENLQEILVIIKADVDGSSEAFKQALEKLEVGNVKVRVIRASVGAISESDVMLASASNAIIYGFNVRPNAVVRELAASEKVEIKLHNVIYKALEEMELAMKGMLAPVYREVITGNGDVIKVFKVNKLGTIAGVMVSSGVVKRNSKVRLIRDGVVIYEGQIISLKRYDDDVKEVAKGYDCGLMISNYNDIKLGDSIETFEDEEVTDE